ncbi:MAG: WG repeat-containing protein, partial [Clostridia bacterium]|nr:WG repeat-containing protein [Clostridia bacterium]
MNLIDENEELEQSQNKKKMVKIIIISIAVLILIAIIILIYTTVKNNNTLKLQVNEENKEIPVGLFYMSDKKNIYVDENNQVYVSIKKLSALLGVEFFNDEYKNKGEDTTKCYIKTNNEYTSYISNSSQIYKAVIVDEQQETGIETTANKTTSKKTEEDIKKVTEYEYFEIENGVKYIDGEIYAKQDAIELGFNVNFSYDQSTKTVKIYTLDALEKIASNIVKNAVIGDNCSYSNKKLLKYGLVLIQNSDNCYGIANYYNYSESDYVVSCIYSDIRFIEGSGTLIVTTADDYKQGILKLDLNNQGKATVKVGQNYQLIRKMDENEELYLIKENGKYGIIRLIGDEIEIVLKSEYQEIGLGDKLYKDMNNKYVINNKYIPVKIDDRWGIVSTEGRLLITPQYPGIGCNLGETGSGDGVIILPELQDGDDGIVFLTDVENGLYSIINVRNGSQIGFSANEIYSKYENNTRNYYMKFVLEKGGAMRNVDIYKQFGRKVETIEEEDINTDNSDDTENSNNNNNNN